jgi:hypothetical protein
MSPYLEHVVRRFLFSSTVLAAIAGGGAAVLHLHATPVPETITPEWYAWHFPGCIDLPCGPGPMFWQQVLWYQVAHRPDFLRAAQHVACDPRRDVLVRSRAASNVAILLGER